MRLVLLLAIWLCGSLIDATAETQPTRVLEKQLSAVVEEFRNRLAISEPIRISLVETNDYRMSVQRSSTPDNAFVISFELDFVGVLSEEALRAVVAHEFGHI